MFLTITAHAITTTTTTTTCSSSSSSSSSSSHRRLLICSCVHEAGVVRWGWTSCLCAVRYTVTAMQSWLFAAIVRSPTFLSCTLQLAPPASPRSGLQQRYQGTARRHATIAVVWQLVEAGGLTVTFCFFFFSFLSLGLCFFCSSILLVVDRFACIAPPNRPRQLIVATTTATKHA